AGQGAADHVQVGAADGAGGEADDGVGVVLNLRLLDVVEPDVADAVEDDCFHGRGSWDGVGRTADREQLVFPIGVSGADRVTMLGTAQSEEKSWRRTPGQMPTPSGRWKRGANTNRLTTFRPSTAKRSASTR